MSRRQDQTGCTKTIPAKNIKGALLFKYPVVCPNQKSYYPVTACVLSMQSNVTRLSRSESPRRYRTPQPWFREPDNKMTHPDVAYFSSKWFSHLAIGLYPPHMDFDWMEGRYTYDALNWTRSLLQLRDDSKEFIEVTFLADC